ncbi:hypothetical protein WJX84_010498 [Apatococcus fuscideae]|uniref:DNA 3'-5' helicase n=1 Tax=Apatococcus fuscideae TaxID=2026836 RepID=A0AAW1SM65_9CHLO
MDAMGCSEGRSEDASEPEAGGDTDPESSTSADEDGPATKRPRKAHGKEAISRKSAAKPRAVRKPKAPKTTGAPVRKAKSRGGSANFVRHNLKVMGFGEFRGRQLEVIRRILAGRSTLAVLPTGAGKSLTYQLPAAALGGTVLVISPLLALMRDQLSHLPPQLPAAMLWGGQSKEEARFILQSLSEGKLRIIYVAPERLQSRPLLEALAPLLPLPLICIDEAHCLAEWGHNFRSAYFRLGLLLRQQIPSRAILALTATATSATQVAIADALAIPPDGIIQDTSLRPNLRMRVSRCEATQADQAARFLAAQGISALSYHAQKPHQEREAIQARFCQGKVRVVTATVAFGMGLDAPGVGGVVHLTLPRSLEEYVQQACYLPFTPSPKVQ